MSIAFCAARSRAISHLWAHGRSRLLLSHLATMHRTRALLHQESVVAWSRGKPTTQGKSRRRNHQEPYPYPRRGEGGVPGGVGVCSVNVAQLDATDFPQHFEPAVKVLPIVRIERKA